MKIKAAVRSKYENLTEREKPIVLLLTVVACLMFIVFLFKCCQTLSFGSKKTPIVPMMIREDHHIIIPEQSALRSQMQIKTVTESTVPHIVSVPGIVEADPAYTVNILPPLAGRIMSLHVNVGDHVKQDQILAVISSPDLAQAYSDNDKAVAVLTLATEALKRAKEVNRAGGNAVKFVQQAQNDYIQALAEAKRSETKLKILGHDTFSLLTIKAPMQGRITALNYGNGSYINDLTAVLLTISNIETIWVTAQVPEHFVGMIAKDQDVTIHLSAYPKEVLQGKISFVNSFLEPDTRRNKTRIVFPNPNGKLQPNMYATVDIATTQPNQILIPVSSILMNNDSTSVYVEISPWTFQQREIELGLEDRESERVLSGLKPGERIVASGGIFIND